MSSKLLNVIIAAVSVTSLAACKDFAEEMNIERYGSKTGPVYFYEYVGEEPHRIYRDNRVDKKASVRERCVRQPGEVLGMLVTICQWERVK